MTQSFGSSLRTFSRIAWAGLCLAPLCFLITMLLMGPFLGWLMASAWPTPPRAEWQPSALPGALEPLKRQSAHRHWPTAGKIPGPNSLSPLTSGDQPSSR